MAKTEETVELEPLVLHLPRDTQTLSEMLISLVRVPCNNVSNPELPRTQALRREISSLRGPLHRLRKLKNGVIIVIQEPVADS